MPIRMIGPEGHSGFSHRGKNFRPDRTGIVAVPDDAVDVARSHGFRMEGEPEPTPARTKDQQIAELRDELVEVRALLDTADQRVVELERNLADVTVVKDQRIAELEKLVKEK